MTATLPPDGFFLELARMGLRRGTNPEHYLVVWCLESSLNPAAVNMIGARGLNQFMPSTLRGIGAPADFERLSAEQQLPWIEKHIAIGEKLNGGPFRSPERYYHYNFLPLTMVRGSSPDAVVAASYADDFRESAAYGANKSLDVDHDGQITVRDLSQALAATRAAFPAAFKRLGVAMQAVTPQQGQGQTPGRTTHAEAKSNHNALLFVGLGALAIVLLMRGKS